MNKKGHWEKVYASKSHKEVSWYSEHIHSSLSLIERTGIPKSAAIVDIGGGASTLCDDLLIQGYRDITIIDISGTALKIARERLGAEALKITWIESDILISEYNKKQFDLWHDRAVFHFLTDAAERAQYRKQVLGHLRVGGYLVFSVFADDGPMKCSMLDVKRHSESDLIGFFSDHFTATHVERTVHKTPAGVEQRFVNIILNRIK